jgi:hypothetical protein
VLFRQNDIAGGPLGRIGAKWGLATHADVTSALLIVAPGDAAGALALVESWLQDPRLDDATIQAERMSVCEEIAGAESSVFVRMRRELLARMVPDHVAAGDYAGTAETLGLTDAASLGRLAQLVRVTGFSMAALGGRAVAQEMQVATRMARPEIPHGASVRLEVAGPGSTRAAIAAIRIFPGARDDGGGVAMAAHAALEFGYVHPGRRSLAELGIRHLEIAVSVRQDLSLLQLRCTCENRLAPRVADAIEWMLADPARGSSERRLRAVLQHAIDSTADDPTLSVRQEARRLFLGGKAVCVAAAARRLAGASAGPVGLACYRGDGA